MKKRTAFLLLFYSVLFSLFITTKNLIGAELCPPHESKYGNRDYLNLNQKNQDYVKTVENAHFNEDVRQLRGGARPSGSLIGDLEYTLNWFPNHHSALDALARLAIKEKSPMPFGGEHVGCRFQWAKNVNPDDGMVYFIEARYHYELGNHQQSTKLLDQASRLDPKNANTQYNIGLLYFRMKDYEAAREHARLAYKLGFPLGGLRNMLKDAGHPLN